jgi:hypothetical protein
MEHFLTLTPFGAVFPPLGLLTLAALTPRDFQVSLCDENAGERVDFETSAGVIGITGYILQMERVFAIADRFRAAGKTVVLGGPLANLLLFGGLWVLFAMTRHDVRLAEAAGRVWGQVAAIPILLLWLASAFGLVKGVLGLVQPHGKKGMAVGGCILNGLLCVGPLAAILALIR